MTRATVIYFIARARSTHTSDEKLRENNEQKYESLFVKL